METETLEKMLNEQEKTTENSVNTENVKLTVVSTENEVKQSAPRRAAPSERAKFTKKNKDIDNSEGYNGIVLYCDKCGCAILPLKNGLYPLKCPSCKQVLDYRGVKFLEESEDILVCGYCGKLTKLTKNKPKKCQYCNSD